MKYCTKCGNPLDDNAIACPKCGSATEKFNSFAANSAEKSGSLSPLAIVGLVLAFVCSLAGLICSVIAHKNAVAESNENSRTIAKLGIIFSAVLLGIELFAVIVVCGTFGCAVCVGIGGIYY